jgi:hypothetical protein
MNLHCCGSVEDLPEIHFYSKNVFCLRGNIEMLFHFRHDKYYGIRITVGIMAINWPHNRIVFA